MKDIRWESWGGLILVFHRCPRVFLVTRDFGVKDLREEGGGGWNVEKSQGSKEGEVGEWGGLIGE